MKIYPIMCPHHCGDGPFCIGYVQLILDEDWTISKKIIKDYWAEFDKIPNQDEQDFIPSLIRKYPYHFKDACKDKTIEELYLE